MRPISRNSILRRSRRLVLSPRVWKPRLVFWTGALAIGVISVLFAKLADEAQGLFMGTFVTDDWRRFLPLVVTPLGFLLCTYMAVTFFPAAQGSGIPQAIAARHLRDEKDRSRFLSLRMIGGKVLLTVTGLLCGASIGREGPTVQIGASIMLQAARIGDMARAQGLILAGSAAGIAAAFNTPLAGIVFAIEEMGRSYHARTNGLILTAVIIAGVASLGIVGNYTYFGIAHMTASIRTDWLLILVCGVAGGALGAGFSRLFMSITRRVRRWHAFTPLRRVLMIAGVSGLVVAVIGVLTDGETFGTGYEQARAAIEGTAPPPAYFLLKMIATLVSSLSGIPGGFFAPSLSVGAGLGGTIASLMGANVGLAALLGMAGYFAGLVQAPMTTFIIVFEMTGNHANVIPLMAVSMIAFGVSRVLSPEPLYHALARLFVADILRQRRAEEGHSPAH